MVVGVVGGGVVPVPVDVLGAVQDAWTLFTGPVPGGTSDEAGVPGGTFTENVSVCPVISVTVTLHWSAEAAGREAIAIVPSAEAAVMARIFSLRPMDTEFRFLPRD